jgi:Iodothyronine deiodinase
LGALEELYDRHGSDVAFLIVYIREAHPEDGWVLADNRREGVALVDPRTLDEREEAAQACAVSLRTRIPMALDRLDDEVASRYGGWPDRLYLVGRDGRIAYQGGEGPFGFLPEELEAAIERELAVGSREWSSKT